MTNASIQNNRVFQSIDDFFVFYADYPRLFDDDVEFALSITLTLLSPMLCQFNFGSNNDLDSLHSLVNDTNSTALRTRSSSQSIVLTSKTYKILFLGELPLSHKCRVHNILLYSAQVDVLTRRIIYLKAFLKEFLGIVTNDTCNGNESLLGKHSIFVFWAKH